MPANALFISIAASSTTAQPAAPACTRTPSSSATSRMMIPWISAVSAERTIWETTSDTRLTGVARKRGITSRSRSLTIAIPLQVAPKKAFMITIAGARNSM